VSFSCGAECLNLALNVVCCETALRLKLRDKPTLRGHRKSRSDVSGFEVLPKRWIVERTFAWISRNRRLARDFERYAMTDAAFVRLALIRTMLRRLAANASS